MFSRSMFKLYSDIALSEFDNTKLYTSNGFKTKKILSKNTLIVNIMKI